METVIGGVRPYRTIRGRFDGSSGNGKPLNKVNGLNHVWVDSDSLSGYAK